MSEKTEKRQKLLDSHTSENIPDAGGKRRAGRTRFPTPAESDVGFD